jgi:hypothetical protein
LFYLYTLKDPETSDIRYVGYSKRPKSRLWEHIRDAKKGVKTHKSYWISNLLSKSLKPILDIVLEKESQDEIATEEILLISRLRFENVSLTNQTDGGDGQRGNKLKDNHPILSWNKGRKMSDESKLKLSESRKGIIFTDSHKYKLSTAKIGHVRSEDSRLKQSETLSESIIVITPDGELLYFNKTMEAVKFTGVNSAQIKKLIQLNKKSKKGFLFKKIIQSLSI